jgi:hypothetical protein
MLAIPDIFYIYLKYPHSKSKSNDLLTAIENAYYDVLLFLHLDDTDLEECKVRIYNRV